MAWSARAIALLLSSAVMPEAFRVRQRNRASVEETRGNATVEEESSRGYVAKLYTWGAPSILKDDWLRDPRRADGCWQGLRIVNVNTDTLTGIWRRDIVVGVATVVGYQHAKQPTVRMDEFGNAFNYPCGEDEEGTEFPWVSIHLQPVYEGRADVLSGEARTLTKYFVVPSYAPAEEAADYIRPSGYKMVGSSMWDEKETHLMQHPSSKDCILAFQGSAADRVLDWYDNLRFFDTNFCGVGDRVHRGFIDQLLNVLQTASFKENIQSKLPKCRDVTVIGHSLGGALAALYSYCVNAAPTDGMDGWEDYQHMQYFRSTPEVLPPIY